MRKVVIIKYNAGNVMSVKYALDRLKIDCEISEDKETIAKASHIIFPGVGEASTAMQSLRSNGLDKLIPTLKQPFMGTCLGMQLLCQHSEEGDASCLGVFDINVKKFPTTDGFKIPQTGWNAIENYKSTLLAGLKDESYVYFNHAFYVPLSDYTVATTDYIFPYSSIIQKDNFFACQFHSEISGDVGESIFSNFLTL